MSCNGSAQPLSFHLSRNAPQSARSPTIPGPRIEIVCHRGAYEIAPENTLAAANRCLAWGVDYVEVDVRPSKEGQLYVLHDATVDRTTDGAGRLDELTSVEIDRLDAGSWFDPAFSGERVPRVETYLTHVKGRAKVFFDIKDADHDALLDLIDRTGYRRECFLWSADPSWSAELQRIAPDLPIKVNVQTPDDVDRASRDLQARIVEVRLEHSTDALIERARNRGIKVMVYHTENEEDAWRKILDLGVEMVNLNHAGAFLQVAESQGSSRRKEAPDG
tara:strand:+ start:25348 stop:26175 length:828 start_codon:yes stop_codon:yes gene_type:complete